MDYYFLLMSFPVGDWTCAILFPAFEAYIQNNPKCMWYLRKLSFFLYTLETHVSENIRRILETILLNESPQRPNLQAVWGFRKETVDQLLFPQKKNSIQK